MEDFNKCNFIILTIAIVSLIGISLIIFIPHQGNIQKVIYQKTEVRKVIKGECIPTVKIHGPIYKIRKCVDDIDIAEPRVSEKDDTCNDWSDYVRYEIEIQDAKRNGLNIEFIQ